jgi:DNA modification methylase
MNKKIKIIQGNCVDKIKELENNSIDCVVSSPPYFGLRDYGVDEQFGLEKTYQDYLANTVKVFETFRPKLKDTATIWWNVGDTYSNYKDCKSIGQTLAKGTSREKAHEITKGKSHTRDSKLLKKSGLKDKDLMMIPNRVAIALQDAGWYIRSEIIWHKPNPMPESVRDRPTSCHEKIWLITKSKKYYYDHEAIKEPITDTTAIRLLQKNIDNQKGSLRGNGGMKSNGNMKAVGRKKFDKNMGGSNTSFVDHSGYKKADGSYMINPTRNKRNVWTITTKPFRDAHFATFPKDLIEPCIKAGCPENGTVLDPFGGSGTTGIVAALNNRNAILIELNQDYIDIANRRINKEVGLFNG